MFYLTNHMDEAAEPTFRFNTAGSVILIIAIYLIPAIAIFLRYRTDIADRRKARKLFFAEEKMKEEAQRAAMSAIELENEANEKRRNRIEVVCLTSVYFLVLVGSAAALVIRVIGSPA